MQMFGHFVFPPQLTSLLSGCSRTPFLKTEQLELLPKHPPGARKSASVYVTEPGSKGLRRAPPRAPLVLSFRGKKDWVS